MLLSALAAVLAATAHGASLDVTASYRMQAARYQNLNLDQSNRNDHSFIENDARLGVAVRKIALESRGGEESTMDVALTLHALGMSNSTTTLPSPFGRAARYYPSTDLTPFIENAYLRIHNLFGKPIETTIGRQSFRLGSGLLLDDDGAGLTGVTMQGDLPWWGMKLEGFFFDATNPNPNISAPSALDLFGFSLALPTDGVWQLNQLVERDHTTQTVYGCSFVDVNGTETCTVSKALRSFTSARYQLNYGPMVFDGEAAIEKGAATPTPGPSVAAGQLATAPNHITYSGDAEVVRAKWKQHLYKAGEGIARISVAHGSGDRGDTATRDEAFFPSHGHRFNGLDRDGFGQFFGATPYDAFGGNYSTTTVSGLRQGVSGIWVVGAGYTPPAYKGVVLDIDYFLYQADRVKNGSRTLGGEWDARLRYNVLDHLALSLSGAWFSAGTASNPAKGTSRKYAFEAVGRF